MTSTLDAHGPVPDPEAADPAPPARPRPDGLDRLRILLAGAMGSVIVSYALLVPALPDRDMLIVDVRGNGRSGRLGCPSFDAMRWIPVVTFWQVTADLPFALDVPLGLRLVLDDRALVASAVGVPDAGDATEAAARIEAGTVVARANGRGAAHAAATTTPSRGTGR